MKNVKYRYDEERLETLLGAMDEFLGSIEASEKYAESDDGGNSCRTEEAVGTLQSAFEEWNRLCPGGPRAPEAAPKSVNLLFAGGPLYGSAYGDESAAMAFNSEEEACDGLRRTFISERIHAEVMEGRLLRSEHSEDWKKASLADPKYGETAGFAVAWANLEGLRQGSLPEPEEPVYFVEFKFVWQAGSEWEYVRYFGSEERARAFAMEEAKAVLEEFVASGSEGEFEDRACDPRVGEEDGMAILYGCEGEPVCAWRVSPIGKCRVLMPW